MFTNSLTKTFVILLVLAVIFVSASFVARSMTPAADLSDYNQIETVRLQRSLNLIAWDQSYRSIERIRISRSSAASTSSYDQVESIRALRTFVPAAADQSYNLVELIRTARGLVADRSYDSIEAIRLLQ
jgi:hypothetical protein